MSGVAHFFVVVGGSKIHERLAHFFIDIYTNKEEVEIGSKKVEIAISSCARYNNMSEISMHEKMFVYGGTRKWES